MYEAVQVANSPKTKQEIRRDVNVSAAMFWLYMELTDFDGF
jgi:hypothetical protein